MTPRWASAPAGAHTAGPPVPDIACCRIGDDLVLLETRGGEYFCLPQAAPEDLDAETLAQIAPFAAAPTVRSAPPQTARLDLRSEPGRADGGGMAFLASAALAYVLFQSKGFAALLRQTERRKAGLVRDRNAVIAASRAFGERLPFAPRRGECFYRSYLLLDALTRQGLAADWVIGVKTWPFAAHCWVQLGEVVLDDEVERVVGFAPILVV